MRNIFVLILFCLFCGCEQVPIRSMNISPEVRMDIYKVDVDGKGFTVKVKFFPKKDKYDAVVQEVIVLNESISIVEAFGENPFLKDVHFSYGGSSFIQKRKMKVYLADIKGADWDILSFAQIPYNIDKTVKTNIPPSWNSRYTSRHKTKGFISKKSGVSGEWRLHYDGFKKIVIISSGKEVFKKQG